MPICLMVRQPPWQLSDLLVSALSFISAAFSLDPAISTNLRSVSGISEGISPTGVQTSASLSLLSHYLELDLVNTPVGWWEL